VGGMGLWGVPISDFVEPGPCEEGVSGGDVAGDGEGVGAVERTSAYYAVDYGPGASSVVTQ
jgi:hypothetical protein